MHLPAKPAGGKRQISAMARARRIESIDMSSPARQLAAQMCNDTASGRGDLRVAVGRAVRRVLTPMFRSEETQPHGPREARAPQLTAEAILILDQQGRIASASEAAAEFFGCSAQELTQNGLDPLLTVIGAPMPWSQILEQASAHAAPAPMPCRVTGPHRMGPQIEAQVSLTPLPVGSEPRYLAVLRTPGGRESRGSDAEVGDAQMRAMMDNSPVLTAYLGRDERYQFSNRAYAQWFGRSIEEVMGTDARKLLSESEYTAAQ